jgi:o-succinylbenzoate---CoA ligase
MDYSFKTIWINGRFVSLQAIVAEKIQSRSAFEASTFDFIRNWLGDKKEFFISTSGSTGDPKKISITREQMMASAMMTIKALRLKKNQNSLICIDTKYIGGQMMLVRSIINDMQIWAIDPCACPLQKIPVDLCVNFAAFVPYQVYSMLESKHPHLLDTPDTIIIGGAPLDEYVIHQLQKFQSRCYATYGMTETISHIALRLLNGSSRSEQFEALDGVTLSLDQRGCLEITAAYLREKIITNDIVDLTGTSRFIWLGRWDNVINTGGIKVLPEKIESTLVKNFYRAGITNRFFIHSLPDVALGNKLIFVLEASDIASPHIVEKIVPIFSSLEKFEQPKEIVISSSFAVTESGKINRLKTMENVHSYRPLQLQ